MIESFTMAPAVGPIDATVNLPGSKSITNRALLLASLADGDSRIEGALFSDDTRYMADALNTLGIPVRGLEESAVYEVSGRGGKIPAGRANLFLGNAGTATRFLTAALALGRGEYHVDGVERMRQRPIADLLAALTQLGVDATADLGTGCPPLTIRSDGLVGGSARMRGDSSSQFLSALLLVAPLSRQGVRLEIEGQLASRPYVEMTLRMMKQWRPSLKYREVSESSLLPSGMSYRCEVEGGQSYEPRTYAVEPDASTASYFFAAAALVGGRVRVNGLGVDALQGDLAFVDILERMGCRVVKKEGYTELWSSGQLAGVDVDMNSISDTVMTLAAIAPFASSSTTIRNVANVRLKETDRLRALTTELRRLGVTVDERTDGLTIEPASGLRPTEIETYEDHRIAMSFAVTGLRSPGVTIKNPACVAKTVPDFFTRFQTLAAPREG